MSAVIFAGGHRFTQRAVAHDLRGRPNRFMWLCEVCGLDVDPTRPFVQCTGSPS